MFSKISIQQMKGDYKSSMGTQFAEYIYALPKSVIAPPDNWIKVENVTYKRVSGNKATYKVHAFIWRENERAMSIELMVSKI